MFANIVHSTEYGSLKPKRREGGGDLASRLFMSGATRKDHPPTPAPHDSVPVGDGGEHWAKVNEEVSQSGEFLVLVHCLLCKNYFRNIA